MIDYGRFTQYTPDQLPQGMPSEMASKVVWIRNEQGKDLYELRKELPKDHQFVVLNDDDTVRVTHTDPDMVFPMDGRLLALPLAEKVSDDVNEHINSTFDKTTRKLKTKARLRVWEVASLFRAMTDAEFDKFTLAKGRQTKRRQAIFEARETIREGKNEATEFIGLMVQEFGQVRTNEILANALA